MKPLNQLFSFLGILSSASFLVSCDSSGSSNSSTDLTPSAFEAGDVVVLSYSNGDVVRLSYVSPTEYGYSVRENDTPNIVTEAGLGTYVFTEESDTVVKVAGTANNDLITLTLNWDSLTTGNSTDSDGDTATFVFYKAGTSNCIDLAPDALSANDVFQVTDNSSSQDAIITMNSPTAFTLVDHDGTETGTLEYTKIDCDTSIIKIPSEPNTIIQTWTSSSTGTEIDVDEDVETFTFTDN